MKKRKTPILLVSILVVLAGGVVVFGMSHNSTGAPKPDDSQQTLQPNQPPSPDTLKSQIAKGMGSRGSSPKMMHPDQGVPHGTGPSISVGAAPVMSKPKPDLDGSTSSQWYDKG